MGPQLGTECHLSQYLLGEYRGAQASILTSGLAERLGLLPRLDRTMAGVAGGVGQAKVLGKA